MGGGSRGSAESFKMMVQAAKPTLFSATGRPELITCVLMANLMCERLWSLAHRIGKPLTGSSPEADRARTLAKIHKYTNSRFYHATPLELAGIWGLHEREYIIDRDDLEASDYAMKVIAGAYELWKENRPWGPMLLEFLKMGLFPEYVYPTVDVILAHNPLLSNQPNRPLGLTSCADECILIASLALVLRCCSLDDVVFLCSPLHYTLFLFPEGSDGFWFNAKREYFDSSGWASLNKGRSQAAVAEAFMSRMVVFDRIITPRGYWIFHREESNLASERVEFLLSKFGRFLGIELKELLPTIGDVLPRQVEPMEEEVLPAMDECESSGAAAEHIRALAESNCASVVASSLYTFRHLEVPEPGVYVSAALSGYKAWLKSAEVQSVSDAVAIVQGIGGRESIFGTTDRIALPDEVLVFNTASDNERVLLLYTLLVLSSSFPAIEKEAFVINLHNRPWSVTCSGSSFSGCDL
jgi:hypothetical protein